MICFVRRARTRSANRMRAVLKTGEELPFVYVNSGFVFYFGPET